jgi:hypothetical protein
MLSFFNREWTRKDVLIRANWCLFAVVSSRVWLQPELSRTAVRHFLLFQRTPLLRICLLSWHLRLRWFDLAGRLPK